VLDRYDLNYVGKELKDVRAKIFQSIDCFKMYLRQEMQEKLGVTDFVSEIKRVGNYPDLEKLAHVIQHGLQGLWLKISKVSQQRQTILVIFCGSGSVA